MLKTLTLAILALTLTGCGSYSQNNYTPGTIAFSTQREAYWKYKYHQTNNDLQKVILWKDMLNSDVLHQGLKEKELIQIFGNDYFRISKPRVNDSKFGVAMVNYNGGKDIKFLDIDASLSDIHRNDTSWCLMILLDKNNKAQEFQFGHYNSKR